MQCSIIQCNVYFFLIRMSASPLAVQKECRWRILNVHQFILSFLKTARDLYLLLILKINSYPSPKDTAQWIHCIQASFWMIVLSIRWHVFCILIRRRDIGLESIRLNSFSSHNQKWFPPLYGYFWKQWNHGHQIC